MTKPEKLARAALPHRRDTFAGVAQVNRLAASTGLEAIADSAARTLIPLIAVGLLGADAATVGIIGGLSTISFLLLGHLAGTLVDRTNPVPLMAAADAVRSLALLTVLIMAWSGGLRIGVLLLAVAMIGVADVFYTAASAVIVPSLVANPDIARATARVFSTNTIANTVGPVVVSMGIAVVGLVTPVVAPMALYLLSAGVALSLRRRVAAGRQAGGLAEAAPGEPSDRGVWGIRACWSFILGERHIRPIVLSNLCMNMGAALGNAVLIVFVVTELGLAEAIVGLGLAVAAVGAVLGAAVAGRLTSKWGIGATRISGCLLAAFGVPCVLVCAAGGGWLPQLGYLLTELGWSTGIAVAIVSGSGIVPRIAPRAMLGRISANIQALTLGVMSLCSIGGGALAVWAGNAPVLLLWSALALGAAVLILSSPLRTWRGFPSELDSGSGDTGRQRPRPVG